MTNRYGLDADYFTKKMQLIIRDIDNYKPSEFARELARMAKTADEKVLNENEFQTVKEKTVYRGCQCEGGQICSICSPIPRAY